MKYSIIIPTYNHLEDCLKPCIESILRYTDLNDAEVIVSANGCTEDTRKYINSLGDKFKLVWNDQPTGYTISTNDGIKVASGDVIILLNNDIELLNQKKNEWIDMLLYPLRDPSIGITGPMQVEWINSGREFLIFFCVAIKREVFDKIGLLDEIYSPGFSEDVDFCIKAQEAGYRLKQVPTKTNINYEPNRMVGGFPIYHKGEETLKHLSVFNSIIGKNTDITRSRYPFFPHGFFGADDIITYRKLVRDNVPVNRTMIELGCFKGKSIASIADIIRERNIQVICVDSFEGSAGESSIQAGPDVFKKEDVKSIFLDTINRFNIAPQIMHMTTSEASTKVQDNYFDLVFIDADHTYEGVKKDLVNWWPKVKRGGILAGHDFAWKSIKDALKEEFGNEVNNDYCNTWFITKPRVYDCFPFFNELDQLEIRLNELDSLVDYFVIVEGSETQQGNPKPLYFEKNKDRFSKFLHKIRHIVVSDWPEYKDGVYDSSWTRERFQRDCIMRGLTDIKDTDVLILGDADEIISAEALRNYKSHMGLCKLEMNFYFYYINYLASDCLTPGKKWMESRIVPVKYFKKYNMTPCSVRYSPGSLQYHHIDNLPSIPNAGWHFSFQGGIDAIMEKIKSFLAQRRSSVALYPDQARYSQDRPNKIATAKVL